MKILKRILSIAFAVIALLSILLGLAEIFDTSQKVYPNYPFGPDYGFWFKNAKTYMIGEYLSLIFAILAVYGAIRLWSKGWRNLFFIFPLLTWIIYMIYEASTF